jgi:site-specific recombinase XerD
MYRRDLTANTLRAAETSLRGFLTFLKNQGKTDLLTVVHNDLEAFVEGLQDRGLKPLGWKQAPASQDVSAVSDRRENDFFRDFESAA